MTSIFDFNYPLNRGTPCCHLYSVEIDVTCGPQNLVTSVYTTFPQVHRSSTESSSVQDKSVGQFQNCAGSIVS